MKITETTWLKYINRLSHLNNTAGDKMAEYIKKHGTEDTGSLIAYAQALVQKYGEGSAELACQMYDATAEASGVALPPAEPAAPAGYRETAGMIRDTLQSPLRMQAGVSRLVKRAGADTTLKNALRDGAEWAWVPHGDTCAFCITLASRGWQRASKKALKGGHAEHIHAHCDCEYAIRFDSSTTVAGYDPDKYLEQYKEADGDINAMRRAHYAQHKDEINAQKRAAYQLRQQRKPDITKVPGHRYRIREEVSENFPKANLEYISSSTYRSLFDGLFKKSKLNGETCKLTRRAIKDNDGSVTESYAFILSDGRTSGLLKSGIHGGNIDTSILAGAPERSAVLTHNHPLSKSFSPDDIQLLLDCPQIGTMIAAGHDGTVYKLTIGKGKRRIDMSIYTRYNLLKGEGKDPNEIVEALAKEYGWRYEYVMVR